MILTGKNKKLIIDSSEQVYLFTTKSIVNIDKNRKVNMITFQRLANKIIKNIENNFIKISRNNIEIYDKIEMKVPKNKIIIENKKILDVHIYNLNIFLLIEEENDILILDYQKNIELKRFKENKNIIFYFYDKFMFFFLEGEVKSYNLEDNSEQNVFKIDKCDNLIICERYAAASSGIRTYIYHNEFKKLKSFHYHSKSIFYLKFSTNGDYLYSVASDKKVLQYNLKSEAKKVIINFEGRFVDLIEIRTTIFIITEYILYVYDRGSKEVINKIFTFSDEIEFINIIHKIRKNKKLEEKDIIPLVNINPKKVRLCSMLKDKNNDYVECENFVFSRHKTLYFFDIKNFEFVKSINVDFIIQKAYISNNMIGIIEHQMKKRKGSKLFGFKIYNVEGKDFVLKCEFKLNINIDKIKKVLISDEKTYFFTGKPGVIYSIEQSGIISNTLLDIEAAELHNESLVFLKNNKVFKDNDEMRIIYKNELLCLNFFFNFVIYNDYIILNISNEIYLGKIEGKIINLTEKISNNENASIVSWYFDGIDITFSLLIESKVKVLNYNYNGKEFNLRRISNINDKDHTLISHDYFICSKKEVRCIKWYNKDY